MPWSPPKRCPHPLCPELTPGGYCKTHRKEIETRRRQRETWRDYGPEWQKVRRRILQLEPACRICGQDATVVDHIVPLQEGGTHAPENLRPLCKSCHDRRTYYDTIGRANA